MRGPNLLFFDSLFGIFFFSFPRIFFFFSPSSFFQQQLLQQQQQLDEPLLLLLNADFEHLVLVIVFCFWLCVLCGTLKKKKKPHPQKKRAAVKFSLYYFFVCVVSKIVRREIKTKNTIGAILRTGTTKLGLLCGTHLWY